MRCGFPACGPAEGLRLLDLPRRTEDPHQVSAAAILGMSRCRSFHEIVRQPVSETGPHKSIRKSDRIKQTSPYPSTPKWLQHRNKVLWPIVDEHIASC